MRKLTDEQLSRVLGEADAGLLDHGTWQYRDGKPCGCVAGAALILDHCGAGSKRRIRMELSDSLGSPLDFEYPDGADAVLRLLESKGLA